MLSFLFKAFVMFLIFLLFQSNLQVVLAHGKGPKNTVHRDLFKTKNPKENFPGLQPCFMCLTMCEYNLSNSCRHSANADLIANMICSATSKVQNYQNKTGEKYINIKNIKPIPKQIRAYYLS